LHFEGAAQGGDFLAHRCNLVLQIELAATALLHTLEPGLHVVEAAGEVALHEIELAAQIENGASRLIVPAFFFRDEPEAALERFGTEVIARVND
jgi:hypothetical protein